MTLLGFGVFYSSAQSAALEVGAEEGWLTLAPPGLEGEEGCTRPVRKQIKINPREPIFWQEWTECCKTPVQRYAAII